MRYQKAENIFPPDVLALIQEYIDGEYVYIPRKDNNRKQWGDNTHSKIETQNRNRQIYALYKTGVKINKLACEFFLSEKSIERIITQGRKQELR